tara:strand:+ start:268 stop:486 length:219 start_codon:yes stop_codon:yes gene_type:complete
MSEIKNESQPNIQSQSLVRLNHQEISKAYKKGELWPVINDFYKSKESNKEASWFKGSRSRGIFNKKRNDIAA